MLWYLPYSENPNKEPGIPMAHPWLISQEEVEGYIAISEEDLNSMLAIYSITRDSEEYQTPLDPVLTYLDGNLSRIDYSNGAFKEFNYTAGILNFIDYTVNGVTTRKTLSYDSGNLLNIVTTVF